MLSKQEDGKRGKHFPRIRNPQGRTFQTHPEGKTVQAQGSQEAATWQPQPQQQRKRLE